MSETPMLLALLIDGDNVNSTKIQEILEKVNAKGKVLIKRVYNNKASMEHWEPMIGKYSLYSVWVPNNTKNKNSVDIALVVDAMTLLYERPDIDGFCIVSSDADHTSLVKHLLTKDKYVLGIGNASTPETFRNACTEFIYTEQLVTATPPIPAKTVTATPSIPAKAVSVEPISNTTTEEAISDSQLLKLVIAAYKKVAKGDVLHSDSGWIQLLNLKSEMLLLKPTFQPNSRVLAERLKALAKAQPRVIEVREQADVKPTIHFVRLLKDTEIDKFRQAYDHAVAELKQGDKQGWVTLAVVGSVLQKMFPKFETLVYQGVKSNQLKTVVEKWLKITLKSLNLRMRN